MNRIVTFGEIMGRLAAPGFQLFRQSLPGQIDLTFAGAEANVAVSLSILGATSVFVTALPKNALADASIDTLKRYGVEVDHIVRSDQGRMGLYFLETGANQRPSRVFYDRMATSFSYSKPEDYDWEGIFSEADWFHTTGISPAISAATAEITRHAVEAAKDGGLTVSCDLNFRNKLWQWDSNLSPRSLAEKNLRSILPFVDVLIANEEDCANVLGIHAGETNVDMGTLDIDRYPEVAQRIAEQYPNLKSIAITLRESISASHNNWVAMLFDVTSGESCFSPLADGFYSPFEIRNIVDRVGCGDSFAAGLIFAMNTPDLSDSSSAVRFATAASCLAHSISGDFNLSTSADVKRLMNGSVTGRVER